MSLLFIDPRRKYKHIPKTALQSFYWLIREWQNRGYEIQNAELQRAMEDILKSFVNMSK